MEIPVINDDVANSDIPTTPSSTNSSLIAPKKAGTILGLPSAMKKMPLSSNNGVFSLKKSGVNNVTTTSPSSPKKFGITTAGRISLNSNSQATPPMSSNSLPLQTQIPARNQTPTTVNPVLSSRNDTTNDDKTIPPPPVTVIVNKTTQTSSEDINALSTSNLISSSTEKMAPIALDKDVKEKNNDVVGEGKNNIHLIESIMSKLDSKLTENDNDDVVTSKKVVSNEQVTTPSATSSDTDEKHIVIKHSENAERVKKERSGGIEKVFISDPERRFEWRTYPIQSGNAEPFIAVDLDVDKNVTVIETSLGDNEKNAFTTTKSSPMEETDDKNNNGATTDVSFSDDIHALLENYTHVDVARDGNDLMKDVPSYIVSALPPSYKPYRVNQQINENNITRGMDRYIAQRDHEIVFNDDESEFDDDRNSISDESDDWNNEKKDRDNNSKNQRGDYETLSSVSSQTESFPDDDFTHACNNDIVVAIKSKYSSILDGRFDKVGASTSESFNRFFISSQESIDALNISDQALEIQFGDYLDKDDTMNDFTDQMTKLTHKIKSLEKMSQHLLSKNKEIMSIIKSSPSSGSSGINDSINSSVKITKKQVVSSLEYLDIVIKNLRSEYERTFERINEYESKTFIEYKKARMERFEKGRRLIDNFMVCCLKAEQYSDSISSLDIESDLDNKVYLQSILSEITMLDREVVLSSCKVVYEMCKFYNISDIPNVISQLVSIYV